MPNRPVLYDEEKQILSDQDDEYEDPQITRARATNKVSNRLYGDTFKDPYQRVEAEALNAVDHSPSDGGYLRAPNSGGYLSASGVSGGFLPALLPFLVPLVISKLIGSGRHGMSPPIEALKLLNPVNFFKTMYQGIKLIKSKRGKNNFADATMGRVFGSGIHWKQYQKNSHGGSTNNKTEFKVGHIAMPMLRGHVRKALQGNKNMDPEMFLEMIEKLNEKEFEQKVTPDVLLHGGSILETVMNLGKSALSKLTSLGVGKLMNLIGKKAVDTGTAVLPKLVETGINKLSEHANKKMGVENVIPVEDLDEELNRKKAELKRKHELKKYTRQLELEDELEDENEDEEPPPLPPRKLSRELPSGESDTVRRKKLVSERKKAVVPVISEPENNYVTYENKKSGMVPKMYDKHGNALYGYGKKKVSGGAWKVQIVRN